jgi:hypothetical protein
MSMKTPVSDDLHLPTSLAWAKGAYTVPIAFGSGRRIAMRAGQPFFLLMPQLAGWPNQSILGLPLLDGHFCVFDRTCHGTGRVRMRVASAHPHHHME